MSGNSLHAPWWKELKDLPLDDELRPDKEYVLSQSGMQPPKPPRIPPTQNGEPMKFDGEKVRIELVPPEFIEATAKVLTFGAKKYSAGNWASGKGFAWSRLFGALLRHLYAWSRGEEKDPESGLSHLAHAACMLCFLICHVERKHGLDDRVTIGAMHSNG